MKTYLIFTLASLSITKQSPVHLTGFMDVSEPSAEYHFAASDGSLLTKDKHVGSFVYSGEKILSYKQTGESIIEISSFNDGYIEKILDTPEISKGELIVKLKTGIVHGRFKLLEPVSEKLSLKNSALWICSYPKPVKVKVYGVDADEIFLSVALGERDYKEIEDKKLKLFFERKNCKHAD